MARRLCILGWLAMQWAGSGAARVDRARWVVAAAVTVVVHLFWAGNWTFTPRSRPPRNTGSSGATGRHFSDVSVSLQHALGIGIQRYGYLPALLSLAWLVQLVADRARGRRLTTPERNLVGLFLGSLMYYLLFPRAVSFHAYQGFYVLPFVALTPSLACTGCGTRTSSARAPVWGGGSRHSWLG